MATDRYIEKSARNAEAFKRRYLYYPSAREAFKAFLKVVCRNASDRVLLPAYIGWSAREGSGVFDPITQLGLQPAFYRVTKCLRIDLEDLEQVLKNGGIRVLVLIHYFGYVDSGYETAVKMARKYGVVILEDEAHAMFTDLIGGSSGRLGDVCIFSLHKMLPVSDGGMLVINPGNEIVLKKVEKSEYKPVCPWEFDLVEISHRRVENARAIRILLKPLEGKVDSLWAETSECQVPQTFPVFIRTVDRNKLYFAMNKAGYGVVSLYHTLIDRISSDEYPNSHNIAKQIMNLPVHQDVARNLIEKMVDKLAERVAVLESEI